jgi:cyclopropane-fatty-acyl-phospholipid synthase
MSTADIKESSTVIEWSERGLVPDRVLRAGIRRLCHQRLKDIGANDVEVSGRSMEAFVQMMNDSAIALGPEIANEQHYEVPPELFSEVLGKHAKYSCCFWGDNTETLDQAEAEALKITCQRAGIKNGMSILDLGCGWGSLGLWIAENYPDCKVNSISNSRPQGEHIRFLARERGLSNIQVVTRDMNEFSPEKKYDRIVSVEMFEHMRNYRELFAFNNGREWFVSHYIFGAAES